MQTLSYFPNKRNTNPIAGFKIKGNPLPFLIIYSTKENPNLKISPQFGIYNRLSFKYKVSNGDLSKIINGISVFSTEKGIKKQNAILKDYELLINQYEAIAKSIADKRMEIKIKETAIKASDTTRKVATKLKIEQSYIRSIISGRYIPRGLDAMEKALQIINTYLELLMIKSIKCS